MCLDKKAIVYVIWENVDGCRRVKIDTIMQGDTGKLTALQVKSLKYDEASGKSCQMYCDGGGLSVKVTKGGVKQWSVSY